VSLLAAIPGLTIVQPGNSEETRALVRWAVREAEESVALRLAIGPSPRSIELPPGGGVTVGRGSVLREGSDAVLLAYGPVLLHEALVASELLAADEGIAVRVVDLPWLNRFDPEWLAGEIAPFEHVLVLEDHSPAGGLGDGLRRALDGKAVSVFGVEGWPACGTPPEALRFHGLDGESLAARIASQLGVRAAR
jgi:transketolase